MTKMKKRKPALLVQKLVLGLKTTNIDSLSTMCKCLNFFVQSKWTKKILNSSKNRLFNLRLQHLLSYLSPTNDLKSVRRRINRAFNLTCRMLRRTGVGLCAKILHAPCRGTPFSIFQTFWSYLLDFGDIISILKIQIAKLVKLEMMKNKIKKISFEISI